MFSWEVLFGLGVVILAVGLIWGLSRNRTRNRANDPVTEAATRAAYDHPEAREAVTRDAQGQVRPQ
jgi:hypothetical protein